MPCFDTISSIDPSCPASWHGKQFLTFDIDWAHDAVLANVIDLVTDAGVAATWFVTHATPLLARLRANPLFELGVHPNFNPLLVGEGGADNNAAGILEQICQIVPEARAVRSHSLVMSERLVDVFRDAGLQRVCNSFIPAESGATCVPWKLWDNMIVIPHCWQDNVAMRLHGVVQPPPPGHGLRVYDFHPIHVYLNTPTVATYEAARPFFQQPDMLARHRVVQERGTRDILRQILEC
ncbi:MAG: hypothetical protein WBK91_05675 [Alphaproteobacteria bacterium]